MKKTIALILTLLIAVGIFSGCSLVQKDAEADGNRVVAEVNGKKLLKQDWYAIYYQYYYMAVYYYGIDASTESGQATLEQYKQSALDQLIYQTLWEQKAEAAGYLNFTDEQRAQAKKEVEEEIEEEIKANAEELKEAVEGQPGYENKDFYAEAKAAYERDMADAGYTVDDLIQDKLMENACNKFKEDTLKDIGPLEADILEKYNELKKSQTETFTDDAKDDYVTAYGDGTIIVKNLAGYSLVQHILIKFTEEDEENVSTLYTAVSTAQSAVDKKQEEIDKSTADDKTSLETELTELKAELTEAQAEYEAAAKEAAKKIQAETDEILASVKDADEAAFIKVLVDKTQDTGMNTEEAAKKGYLVGDEDGMVTEFHDAAVALKNAGDISQPVLGPYGYHIIRKIKDIPEGYVNLDDVKEEITEELTTTMQDEKWETYQSEWYKAANIKTYDSVMND